VVRCERSAMRREFLEGPPRERAGGVLVALGGGGEALGGHLKH
jgi:hypothetical protein